MAAPLATAVAATVAVLVVAGVAPLAAQDGDPLLGLTPGARAAGMGRAASALGGEPDAVPLNPAAAAGSRGWVQAARLTSGALADVSANAVSAATPFLGGIVAVGLSYDDYGEITRTSSEGELELGTVSLHDLALAVTYARPLLGPVTAGVAGRYVRSGRGVGRATGASFDVGLLVRAWSRLPVALALSVRNAGAHLRYELDPGAVEDAGLDSDSTQGTPAFDIPLPTRIRGGAALGPFGFSVAELPAKVTLTYDAEADAEGREGLNHFAGFEMTIKDVLSLRAGALTQTNPFERESGRTWGYSAGIGLASRGWTLGVAREMGLSSLGDQTHLSAGYRF